jgi:hypothetical protein
MPFTGSKPLPAPETPLYNHPLPLIEDWLIGWGCRQDGDELNRWTIERPDWRAELTLEEDRITVRYVGTQGDRAEVTRTFKYSLSRQDLDDAIFSGP